MLTYADVCRRMLTYATPPSLPFVLVQRKTHGVCKVLWNAHYTTIKHYNYTTIKTVPYLAEEHVKQEDGTYTHDVTCAQCRTTSERDFEKQTAMFISCIYNCFVLKRHLTTQALAPLSPPEQARVMRLRLSTYYTDMPSTRRRLDPHVPQR
jgi:hypothetical protein